MFVLTFGVFGLIVGSFLNVIILRHGVRPVGGRSGCMSCGKQLPWYDMIPVFSWFVLGGRCRFCRARISLQYPLTEAATAVLFAFIGGWAGSAFTVAADFGVTLTWLITFNYLVIVALLVAIFVYDLHHTLIPDGWVYTFIALAFFGQFLLPFWGEYGYWLFLAGPVVALPIFALWGASFVRHGTPGMWMGFGDVKLALGIGWLLGPALGLLAIFGAFIIGAVVSIPLLFFSSSLWQRVSRFIPYRLWPRSAKGFTMKSEIPFGPFLVASTFIIWFASLYGIDSLRIFGLLL